MRRLLLTERRYYGSYNYNIYEARIYDLIAFALSLSLSTQIYCCTIYHVLVLREM